MRPRVAIVLCSLIASLFIYCGESAMKGKPDGGGLGDAGAQACCTTANTFTFIAEGKVNNDRMSGDIAVGAYHDIVIYTRGLDPASPGCKLQPMWRPDAQTPYSYVGVSDVSHGARIAVEGSDLQLTYGTCGTLFEWVVAGVK